ncbi:hypothetical protein SCP_0105930 [Sparassis crispa]|uniref:Uncharacterized protein n=1 Tax=Sparassis crispa TaxID=139825 RepID=A0A401G6B8_9APHY|nr:hypothetical protein SCP_0105930 [Sparassis crispa]GBE77711.1 hypothetical protein SCP_0105930 [Sparassis crispa]
MGTKTSDTSSDTPLMEYPHPLLARRQNQFPFDLALLVRTYPVDDLRYPNHLSRLHPLLRVAVIPTGMDVSPNKDHEPAGGHATDVEEIIMSATAPDDDEDHNISCGTRNVRRELMLQRSPLVARLFFFFSLFPLRYQTT